MTTNTRTDRRTKAELAAELAIAQAAIQDATVLNVDDFMANVAEEPVDLAELLTGGNPEVAPPRNMARQLDKYAPGYVPGINAKGQKTLTNGDDLATTLLALTPEQVMRLAERSLGFEDGELALKYDRLNPGQKRMNAGNRIRSAIKRGDVTLDLVKGEIPGLMS